MGSVKSCDINKLSWGGVRSTLSQVKSLSTLYTFHLFQGERLITANFAVKWKGVYLKEPPIIPQSNHN